MKATMSKDNQVRFTLMVPFRAGRQEFIEALVWAFRHDEKATIEESWPKKKLEVVSMLRGALRACGNNLWAEAEDGDSELWERATETVDRMFPELLSERS